MLTFVLGFFMSLGKAAVYKHIPIYYPGRVGAVGGVVGLIGGLGGFVLPIAFGAMNDLVGVWTSCFMLMFIDRRRVAPLDALRHPAHARGGRRRNSPARNTSPKPTSSGRCCRPSPVRPPAPPAGAESQAGLRPGSKPRTRLRISTGTERR